MELNKLAFRERISHINPRLCCIPKGYKRIENKIIVRHRENLDREFGNAVMASYSWCSGVFQHITTSDGNRRPQLVHLAGEENTEVIHTENNAKYHLDIAKITFSGGNRQLRERLASTMKDGENLLDMFAAVGNLSLQIILKRKISAILIERDPYTFSFLKSTIKMNKLESEIYNMDCRDIKIKNWADRIFMGYHNVNESHIAAAIYACKTRAVLHLHPLAYKQKVVEWVDLYSEWITSHGVKIINSEERIVKSYSPNLDHIEIVITIQK